jgi:hypothetical protein
MLAPLRGWLALGALLAAGCGARPAGAWGEGWTPQAAATAEIAAMERAMFDRLNRDRRAHGLAPLGWDPRLADIARAHALDMRDHRFFAHDSPYTGTLEDRVDRAGYLALESRENLASATDVETAEDNLLASVGHRANLLATTVSHVGVGIVRGGHDGDERLLTITQVFARPVRLPAPDEVTAAAAARIGEARRAAGLSAPAPHARLSALAAQEIANIPDALPEEAMAAAGKRASAALSLARERLRSVALQAQLVAALEQLKLPDDVLDPAPLHLGLAAVPARDPRGRPRVKLLVLLGR